MTCNSDKEFYFKGIYPVEVVSEAKAGFVEVRVKSAFLYSECAKQRVQMGMAEKRLVKPGEVLYVLSRQVWPFQRSVEAGCSDLKKYSETYDGIFRARYSRRRASVCKRCQKAFVEGDKIHVVNHGHKPKIYHKACWDAMFI